MAKIPEEQWELPASFSADGSKMVSLRDVAATDVATMSLSQLSDEQLTELVTKRIELQPDFEMGMIGAGLVDKQRALLEVKARTQVGRTLMEIEQRVINSLLEEARKSEGKE